MAVTKRRQPEALAEFAESARDTSGDKPDKSLTADRNTKPIPESNKAKHKAATHILHDGAEGEQGESIEQETHKLPDRIIESR